VKASNASGSATSNNVVLTVTGDDIFENGFDAAVGTTSPPSDPTVTIGRAAQFSVTTTAATPPDQRPKNGVAGTGTDAATYTTVPATAADNGARFDVVVGSDRGTAFSAKASSRSTTFRPL
jgi:hypothetical protein